MNYDDSKGNSEEAKKKEFEKLLMPTMKPIMRYLSGLIETGELSGKVTPEDLFQEASINAWKAFDTYKIKLPFFNWFREISFNVYLNARREPRNKADLVSINQNHTLHYELLDKIIIEIPDTNMDIEQKIELMEMREILYREILTLSDKLRQTISLRYIEGLSYVEIAQATKSTMASVKLRIFRGKRLLQKKMEKYLDQEMKNND